jgi:hypothetical protein
MSKTIWELGFADLVSPSLVKMQQNINSTFGTIQQKENALQQTMNTTAVQVQKNNSLFKQLGGTIAGAFAGIQLFGLGKEIVNITGEFQKYEAVLTNTLGNKELAQGAISMIKDFAKTTPFQVNELTNAYVKLANQGFIPLENEMKALGDLASSTGKPFEQLAEAILDAKTFQFERLKEFGIKGALEGNKLLFTFKGITTEVGKNSSAVEDYLISLGNIKGVTGAMEAISKTLPGIQSNLLDKVDEVLLKIGTAASGALFKMFEFADKSLTAISNLVDWVIDNKDPLLNFFTTITYGVGAVSVAWGVYNGVLLYTSTILPVVTFLMSAQGGAVGLAQLAWWGLNAAIMANPLAWVAGLVGVLTTAVVYAWRNFEGFKGTIYGLWEAAKQVFTNIGNFFKQIFTPIFEAMELFKQGKYLEAGGKVLEMAYNITPVGMTANAIGFAQDGGLTKGVTEAFDKGYGIGAKEFKQDNKTSITDKLMGNVELPKTDGSGKPKTVSPTGSSLTSNGGNGSGSGRNINIEIKQLVGSISISTNNLQESASKIKSMVAEALVSAVRDTELTIS